MIKFKLMDKFAELINSLIEKYPELKDVKCSICWDSTLNDEEPKRAGRFVVFEDEDDGYEIRVNPLTIDFATIAFDTLPHEFAHMLDYINDKNCLDIDGHNKIWENYMEEIQELFMPRDKR